MFVAQQNIKRHQIDENDINFYLLLYTYMLRKYLAEHSKNNVVLRSSDLDKVRKHKNI